MAIMNLFSKRQRKMRGEKPDVYIYDEISQTLRIQIIYIITDTLGQDKGHGFVQRIYSSIYKILCKEYGLLFLKEYRESDADGIFHYFLNCDDPERCLDIIELCFRFIKVRVGENYQNYQYYTTSKQDPESAIKELNIRYQEAGIGYRFESKELIRIDSQFIHSEAVKPALQLLHSFKGYQGANSEFLSAHEHYRNKRYKECLNDCLKSFESLIKAIHDKRSWQYNKNDTAKRLITSCFTNNLVPEYFQSQFSALRALLESGVPTVRNKNSGHGQGAAVLEVPEHLASYALHLTATNL